MSKKNSKTETKEHLIVASRCGEITTWEDVFQALKKLTPEQRKQNAMLLPPSPLPTPLLLEPVVAIGTVEQMCHVEGKIVTKTRSADDFQHHPEQVVLLYDGCPFDEDGNSFFTMTEKGMVGNKTGKVYPFGEKRKKK